MQYTERVPESTPSPTPRYAVRLVALRTGLTPHVLRAWENRYGLLQPVRSPGGFRLYSEADEWRIRHKDENLIS